MSPQEQSPKDPQVAKTRPRFPLLPFTTFLLGLAVIVMLVLWKPWQPTVKASDRTISVTGNATITATPDEYTFNPSYNFEGTNKATILKDVSNKSAEVITKVKALGVTDAQIKSNASGYNNGIYFPVQNGATFTYTLTLTITLGKSAIAQKVQDYLVSTEPTGAVSPSVNFSKATLKTLQDKARNEAEKDARSKADQSAKNLGFSVTHVKTVADGDLYNEVRPVLNKSMGLDDASSSSQLTVQPGQNDLPYSVTIVYYIR